MSIQVAITATELVRTYTAAAPGGEAAVSVSVHLPALLREDRTALICRARELLAAVLDTLGADAP